VGIQLKAFLGCKLGQSLNTTSRLQNLEYINFKISSKVEKSLTLGSPGTPIVVVEVDDVGECETVLN
jgi:hypothetical protein